VDLMEHSNASRPAAFMMTYLPERELRALGGRAIGRTGQRLKSSVLSQAS
jgi:hypothetical protein